MGLINLEPTLHPGEEVRWRRPAARSLSDRTVAGTLYLSTHGIVFMPNRLNRRRDLVSMRIPSEQIADVGVADPVRSLSPKRDGSIRRRLALREHQGDLHLFVINRPEQVAGELRSLLWP